MMLAASRPPGRHADRPAQALPPDARGARDACQAGRGSAKKHAAFPLRSPQPLRRREGAREGRCAGEAESRPGAEAEGGRPGCPGGCGERLPGALDMLLHGHRVVIVALWDPEIPSDRYAFLEAQAGAKAANAGFSASASSTSGSRRR